MRVFPWRVSKTLPSQTTEEIRQAQSFQKEKSRRGLLSGCLSSVGLIKNTSDTQQSDLSKSHQAFNIRTQNDEQKGSWNLSEFPVMPQGHLQESNLSWSPVITQSLVWLDSIGSERGTGSHSDFPKPLSRPCGQHTKSYELDQKATSTENFCPDSMSSVTLQSHKIIGQGWQQR